MKDMLALTQDAYLWGGVAALILSIVGIRWILRSMHAQSEEPETFADAKTAFQTGIFGPPPTRVAETVVSEPEPAANRTARAVRSSDDSVEALAQQLDRIEQTLNQIVLKLGQTGSKPAAGSGAQIDQIAVKIDKIYQVLAQLSSEDAKP